MSRPQKQTKRTIRQTVNFTPEEFKKAKEKADRLNMGFAEYLRTSAVRLKVQEPSRDYSKVLSQLGKIGSNLNQITKKVNQAGKASEKDKEALNKLYLKFEQVKKLLE